MVISPFSPEKRSIASFAAFCASFMPLLTARPMSRITPPVASSICRTNFFACGTKLRPRSPSAENALFSSSPRSTSF